MKADQKNENLSELLRDKVIETNRLVSRELIIIAAICLTMGIIFKLGLLRVTDVENAFINDFLINIALFLTPAMLIFFSIWCLIRKGQGFIFQHIFLALLVILWLELELLSGYKCELFLPILIVTTLRYYNSKLTIFVYFISVAALFASVWCNAYLYVKTRFIDLNLVSLDKPRNITLSGYLYDNIIDLNPSHEMLLSNGMRLTFIPDLVFLTIITVIVVRFMNYNLKNYLHAKKLYRKEADHRVELSDLKTKNMLSQVKPHFIYNTLSSIAMLCTKDPIKAKSLVLSFAEYLRGNLDTLDENANSTCSFVLELEHIRNYIDIELVRFGDKLSIRYDINETDFSVPALSVQALVENAVKHGVCQKEDGGTVRISTKAVQGEYIVRIQDDGVGFDMEKVKYDGKVHIGIINVQKRLELIGGRLEIESSIGFGTTATIFIPREVPVK